MSHRGGLRARRRHSQLGRRSHAPTDVSKAVGGNLYGGELSKEGLHTPDILAGSIGHGHILPGAVDLDLFAETIVPPRVLDALPSLPDDDYPEGMLVFLTTDGKLYRNVADAWDTSVDGGDIIADSITAGSIAAGAIGTEQLAADAIIANVVNVSGSVVIDDDGITITDEFGGTAMTAQGFQGAWLSFLMSGLYNNQFAFGVNGALTYQAAPSASEVPFWSHELRSHSTMSITRVAAASAPGGAVMRFQGSATTGGVTAWAKLRESTLHRVQGGRSVIGRVAWRASGAALSDEQRVRFDFDWYDADGVFISATVSDTPERAASDPADTYIWDHTAPAEAPQDAAFVKVGVRGYWNIGIQNTADYLDIAEVSCKVHDYEFQQLLFSNDLTLDRFSDNFLRLTGDSGDVAFLIEAVNDAGFAAFEVWVDGDAAQRAIIGIESGDAVMMFGDGSAIDWVMEHDGSGRMSITDGYLRVANAGQAVLQLAPEGWIEFNEQGSAVPNASAGGGRLYVTDNGSGKTVLRARFATGGSVDIATEP